MNQNMSLSTHLPVGPNKWENPLIRGFNSSFKVDLVNTSQALPSKTLGRRINEVSTGSLPQSLVTSEELSGDKEKKWKVKINGHRVEMKSFKQDMNPYQSRALAKFKHIKKKFEINLTKWNEQVLQMEEVGLEFTLDKAPNYYALTILRAQQMVQFYEENAYLFPILTQLELLKEAQENLMLAADAAVEFRNGPLKHMQENLASVEKGLADARIQFDKHQSSVDKTLLNIKEYYENLNELHLQTEICKQALNTLETLLELVLEPVGPFHTHMHEAKEEVTVKQQIAERLINVKQERLRLVEALSRDYSTIKSKIEALSPVHGINPEVDMMAWIKSQDDRLIKLALSKPFVDASQKQINLDADRINKLPLIEHLAFITALEEDLGDAPGPLRRQIQLAKEQGLKALSYASALSSQRLYADSFDIRKQIKQTIAKKVWQDRLLKNEQEIRTALSAEDAQFAHLALQVLQWSTGFYQGMERDRAILQQHKNLDAAKIRVIPETIPLAAVASPHQIAQKVFEDTHLGNLNAQLAFGEQQALHQSFSQRFELARQELEQRGLKTQWNDEVEKLKDCIDATGRQLKRIKRPSASVAVIDLIRKQIRDIEGQLIAIEAPLHEMARAELQLKVLLESPAIRMDDSLFQHILGSHFGSGTGL